MHKRLLYAVLPTLLSAVGAFSAAAQAPADSLQVEQLQEVVIGAAIHYRQNSKWNHI